jgi:hypothetical protein
VKQHKTVTRVIVHQLTPNQISQEQTPTNIVIELSAPPTLSNSRRSKIRLSARRRKKKPSLRRIISIKYFAIATPVIQKNDDSDCSKVCKEYYYMTKQDETE